MPTKAVLLAAAILVSVAACGDASQEPEPTSSSRPVVGLPFDAYKLGSEDHAVADAAQTVLVRDCMATKGFGWTRPRIPAGAPVLVAGNARRYGLADADAAERYGYHVPTEPERARALADEAAWADRLSEDERRALFDPGGWADQAQAALWEGADPDNSWFVGLSQEAVDRSAEDPAVVSATTAWSRCMREGGFDYRTPLDAVEDPRWNLDVPRVSPTERAVATADVRCKDRTDLVTTRAAAEKRIQTDMIRQHATRFEALRQSNQRYLHNAQRILDDE